MKRFICLTALFASVIVSFVSCSDEDVWTGPKRNVNLVRDVKWWDECRLEYDSRNRIGRVSVAYPSAHFYGAFTYDGERMRFDSRDYSSSALGNQPCDAYVKARLNASGYITSCEIWLKGRYDWETGSSGDDTYVCSYKFVYSPGGYLLRIEKGGQAICEYRWDHENLIEIVTADGSGFVTRHRFEYNGMCTERINLNLLYFNVYGLSLFNRFSGGNMLRQLGCCNFFGCQSAELPVAFERSRKETSDDWYAESSGVYAYNVDERGVVTRMDFTKALAVELSY